MNDVIRLLQSHRSIRKFTDEPIEPALFESLIVAGQAAATSSNIQACTVIRVVDPRKRATLAACAGGQTYVETAAEFLVFCADLARPAAACVAAGGDFVPGMTEHFLIASIDVALFAQNVVIAAESAGLGICYIGGLRNDPQTVSVALDLPEQVYPVFGLCLGHPAQDPQIKPRQPLHTVLHQDRYEAERSAPGRADYDQAMRAYYRERTGGAKDSDWSSEMAALVGKESRPHMLGFLQARGFLKA